MRGRRTHEQLEHAAEQLKRLSELADGVVETRRERDRLVAKLFRERTATTGELVEAARLSPNRIRAIASQEPDEPEPEPEEPAKPPGRKILFQRRLLERSER